MKTYCWLSVALSFFLFTASPIAFADAEEDETTTSEERTVQLSNLDDSPYESRRYFHYRRGNDGKGYTRYDGRRFTTGRDAAAAAKYSKGAIRERLKMALGLKRNSSHTQATADHTNYLEGAEYDPRKFYHKNRFQKGYTRYEIRRHSSGDYVRRGSRLFENGRNREPLDTLDYWRNYGTSE